MRSLPRYLMIGFHPSRETGHNHTAAASLPRSWHPGTGILCGLFFALEGAEVLVTAGARNTAIVLAHISTEVAGAGDEPACCASSCWPSRLGPFVFRTRSEHAREQSCPRPNNDRGVVAHLWARLCAIQLTKLTRHTEKPRLPSGLEMGWIRKRLDRQSPWRAGYRGPMDESTPNRFDGGSTQNAGCGTSFTNRIVACGSTRVRVRSNSRSTPRDGSGLSI